MFARSGEITDVLAGIASTIAIGTSSICIRIFTSAAHGAIGGERREFVAFWALHTVVQGIVICFVLLVIDESTTGRAHFALKVVARAAVLVPAGRAYLTLSGVRREFVPCWALEAVVQRIVMCFVWLVFDEVPTTDRTVDAGKGVEGHVGLIFADCCW